MNLVKISKEQLHTMRGGGWDSLMNDIFAFCAKKNIAVPEMMSPYVPLGRGIRNLQEETNLHHFQVGLFNNVIDMQIAALNDRFDEENTELLLCMSHLNPNENFSAFDKAIVERVFSAMKIVKNRLRNRIGDEYLNECLVTYIEREIFRNISNEKIRKRFQGMAKRRGHC